MIQKMSLIITSLLISTLAFADEKPLTLGIFPWAKESLITTVFQPIVNEISSTLNRPVTIHTPSSYSIFLKESLTGKYDLVYPPVSFSFLLMEDAGYSRLVAFTPPPKVIICTKKTSLIKTLNDLKGKKLASFSALSTSTLLLNEEFHKSGFKPKEIDSTEYRTHDAALMSVIRGENDAAITTPAMASLLDPKIWEGFVIIYEFANYPYSEILAGDSLDKKTIEALRQSLITYSTGDRSQSTRSRDSGFSFIAPPPEAVPELKRLSDLVRKELNKGILSK